jgi:hypothetical protein
MGAGGAWVCLAAGGGGGITCMWCLFMGGVSSEQHVTRRLQSRVQGRFEGRA